MSSIRSLGWLEWLKGKLSLRDRRWQSRSCKRRFIPRLEVLEDRALPSILTVTSIADNGAGSLRQAIAMASSSDTIQFAAHLEGQTITLSTGPLAITQNLDIKGLRDDEITISGDTATRVFDIASGTTVTIAGLTITNGLDQDLGQGGAIDNAGILTLANCTLSNNNALGTDINGNGMGGGIFNEPGATLIVTQSTFIDNQAFGGQAGFGWGGALMNKGAATVTDSTFTGNQANGGGASFSGSGGAISNLNNATLSINNCTFTNNSAIGGFGFIAFGGALDNALGSSVTVSNSTFTGNQALSVNPGNFVGEGGAIGNTSTFSIIGCSFTGNRAVGLINGLGGAVDNYGQGSITTSTFSSNVVTATAPSETVAGGAIRMIFGASLTISDSTFADNKAVGTAGTPGQDGGGALGGGIISTFGCTLNLTNCTFTGNQAVAAAGGAGANGGDAEGGGLTTGMSISGTATATVTNCTFTDNQAIGGAGGAGGTGGRGQGGGLENLIFAGTAPSNLTLANSTLTDNQAIGGAGGTGGQGGDGLGGGIYQEGVGLLSVADTTLARNQAIGGQGGTGATGGGGLGGAIVTQPDASGLAGTVSISNSMLTENTAAGGVGGASANGGNGFGGGIYVANTATISVTGSTITHNRAQGGEGDNDGNGFGGGIYVDTGGTIILIESTIIHNRAKGGEGDDDGNDGQGVGGGVYNLGTLILDVATIIAHNHASTSNDNIFT